MKRRCRNALIFGFSGVVTLSAFAFLQHPTYNTHASLYYFFNAIGCRDAAIEQAKHARAHVPIEDGWCVNCILEVHQEQVHAWTRRIDALHSAH